MMNARKDNAVQRVNASVFEDLLGGEFNVRLVTQPDKELRCRRIPFLTVTRILSNLLRGTTSEYQRVQSQFLPNLLALLPSVEQGLAGWKVILGDAVLYSKLTSLLSPLLTGIAIEVPDTLRDLLCDVVVDGTPELVDRIASEDALEILTVVASRMDTAVLARQVRELFLGLKTAILTNSQPPMMTSTSSSVDSSLPQDDPGS